MSSGIEIMIDGDWIKFDEIHRKTVETVISGRHLVPVKAEWSLSYWILQCLRVGF
jgi:hypothetical protein